MILNNRLHNTLEQLILIKTKKQSYKSISKNTTASFSKNSNLKLISLLAVVIIVIGAILAVFMFTDINPFNDNTTLSGVKKDDTSQLIDDALEGKNTNDTKDDEEKNDINPSDELSEDILEEENTENTTNNSEDTQNTQEDNEEEKQDEQKTYPSFSKTDLIGTWEGESSDSILKIKYTWIFYNNNSLKLKGELPEEFEDYEMDEINYWYNYEVNNNRLCVDYEGYTNCSRLNFSNDKDSFTVGTSYNEIIFNKI